MHASNDDAGGSRAETPRDDASPASSLDARADVLVAADARRADAARAVAACQGTTADVDADVSADTFACCTTYLKGELVDAGDNRVALAMSNSESTRCCASVVSYVEHSFQDGDASAAAYMTAGPLVGFEGPCCKGETEDAPVACGAWGPPAPPAMNWSAHLEVA